MRATKAASGPSPRKLLGRVACALTALALVAGCPQGGIRRAPLEPTVGIDAGDTAPPEQRYMCSGSISALNCAAPFVLPADGHVTDFSYREWNPGPRKWCNVAGMHGAIFSFPGSNTNDHNDQTVNTDDGSFRLILTVSPGSYGGGGLAFEAGCVDASAFEGVHFSIAVASGSLTGCTYQLQLQTFEQRPIQQNSPNPPGGCDQNTTSCYSFPAATGLPAPSTDTANPTQVMIPFSSFAQSGMMPAPKELVGLQWQVNASGAGCTVELRIDDVGFIPAAAPPPTDAATD